MKRPSLLWQSWILCGYWWVHQPLTTRKFINMILKVTSYMATWRRFTCRLLSNIIPSCLKSWWVNWKKYYTSWSSHPIPNMGSFLTPCWNYDINKVIGIIHYLLGPLLVKILFYSQCILMILYHKRWWS